MSRNKTLIVFTVLALIVAASVILTHKNDRHAGHDHSNHDHSTHGITAKLSAGVDAEFEMLTESPAPNSDIEVKAMLNALAENGNFEYKWHMPGNTQLKSPASGNVELIKGDQASLSLVFSQSVSYDMKIHLEIRKKGSDNSSMFTLSTLDFHRNQQQIKSLQQRQSEYKK